MLILFHFYYNTVLLQLWFGWSVLLHHCIIGIMIRPISSFSRLFYWNYYLSDSIWLLLHHCFISIMICLISSIARLFIAIMIRLISSIPSPFNCIHYLADFFYYLADFFLNYPSVAFFYSTTVCLGLRFGWFYLTSITPLFYCNYNLADLFSCTIFFLYLWFGLFLLLHDCFPGIINWLILFDFYYNTVLYQLWFAWSLLLHDCLIAIMIRLIFSIPPPSNFIFYLADLFYTTTVFIAIMI